MLAFLFTSCQKEEEDSLTNDEATQEMIVASEDNSTAEDLYQGVEDQVDLVIDTRGGGNLGCMTVTVEPSWDEFPRTVTIDFGTAGCEGADGRIRKGQIVVEQTDVWWDENAVRTTDFIDFFIEGAQLEGKATLINEGYDADGNITFSRTVEDAKITFPNGDVTTWESSQLLVQTDGGSTPFILLDNEFEYTGNSSGVNRNGQDFTVQTTSPLVKKKSCAWLVSGIIEVTVADKTLSLDYGNGNCDKFGMLTFPNGTEMEIKVRRSW